MSAHRDKQPSLSCHILAHVPEGRVRLSAGEGGEVGLGRERRHLG